MTDRSDAEIAQDLRADADLAPLPIAVGLRGFFFRQRRNRNAGSTITQIHQNTVTSPFEMFEHGLNALGTGKDICDDVGLVKASENIFAVADTVINEGDMRDGIEWRSI